MTTVHTIDKQHIYIDDEEIPISENYKDQIAQYIEHHTLA
jgi:hypothetical protein